MEKTCLQNDAADDEQKGGCNEQTKGYILGTDFGSTNLTVKIYDLRAHNIDSITVKLSYLSVAEGGVEIDPIQVFNTFVETVKELLLRNNIDATEIKSSGFSFQRGTFLLWDKETGEPRCNLISWQDTRCAAIVDETNRSYLKRAINIIGSIAYKLFWVKKFLVMKVLQFQVAHTSMKLMWLLKSDTQLRDDVNKGNVLFGTIDTWIVWKLTGGSKHVTDFTCAGGTAIFDPYLCEWSSLFPTLFGIPLHIFPTVVDSSGFIADTKQDIFGASIPINSIVADSQAGMFGLKCYDVGQSCCLMGTGCYFSINTGSYAHASIAGLYPQIGWKIKEDLVYTCEGYISGIAPSIEWAGKVGMFDDVMLTSDIAKSIADTDGVYFIPGFSGLTAPHNDPNACCGLIGVNRSTTKAHIVRAILEGIAFRYLELYQVALDETKLPFHSTIKVSGGLTNNDFLMELISSLTNCSIEKSEDCDISLTGAVYLAGLGSGIWKSKKEVCKLSKPTKTFEPDPLIHEHYMVIYKQWLKATRRCLQWYS